MNNRFFTSLLYFFTVFGAQEALSKEQHFKTKTRFAHLEEHEWRDQKGNRVFKQVFNDRGDLLQEHEFSSAGQMFRSKIIDPEAGIVRIITPEYDTKITLDEKRKRRKIVTHIKEQEIVIWTQAAEPCSQCDSGFCGLKGRDLLSPDHSLANLTAHVQQLQQSKEASSRSETVDFVFIDPECVNTFGNHIRDLIDEVRREGEQCFSRLQGRQSQLHLFRWKSLFENTKNPPKIFCQTSKINNLWHFAESTLPGQPNHPEVRVNPTKVELKNKREFKEILFHEFVHNIGYSHSNEVEYGSVCAVCCNSTSRIDKRVRHLACAICDTDSNRYNQMDYLEKLVEFETLNGHFPYSYQSLLVKILHGSHEEQKAAYQLLKKVLKSYASFKQSIEIVENGVLTPLHQHQSFDSSFAHFLNALSKGDVAGSVDSIHRAFAALQSNDLKLISEYQKQNLNFIRDVLQMGVLVLLGWEKLQLNQAEYEKLKKLDQDF